VKIEPDPDYYKDLGAHFLLEVVANAVSHTLNDPKQVYMLRWIAGLHAGMPVADLPWQGGNRHAKDEVNPVELTQRCAA
jgi:hypothetical protein